MPFAQPFTLTLGRTGTCCVHSKTCLPTHAPFAPLGALLTPVVAWTSLFRLESSSLRLASLPSHRPKPPFQLRVNTAKLSSILLNRTTRLSFAGDPRPRRPSSSTKMPLDAKEIRRRRSSSLVYTEPPESLEQLSDQSVLPNLNAQWVNAKGECILPSYNSWALI